MAAITPVRVITLDILYRNEMKKSWGVSLWLVSIHFLQQAAKMSVNFNQTSSDASKNKMASRQRGVSWWRKMLLSIPGTIRYDFMFWFLCHIVQYIFLCLIVNFDAPRNVPCRVFVGKYASLLKFILNFNMAAILRCRNSIAEYSRNISPYQLIVIKWSVYCFPKWVNIFCD